MPTPIPPVLTPYVAPAPQGSLTLVTSILDATSNWLLLRNIYATLENHRVEKAHERGDVLASSVGQELQEHFKVIFVSVLRGFEQWREMGKRMVGDLLLLWKSRSSWEDLDPYALCGTSLSAYTFQPRRVSSAGNGLSTLSDKMNRVWTSLG